MRQANHNGFTLLEILIAMFIFTIIAAIMTHALHNAIGLQAETEKKSQAFSELQHALLMISRDSEQIINRPVINYQSKVETAVVGTPNQITFSHAGLENPNGILPRSTLERVSYHVVKHNLVRDTWGVLDQTPKSTFQTRILLHDVTSIHFDYLNDKKLYNEQWPEPNSSQQSPMPRAIRMTLVLAKMGTLEQTYIVPDQTQPQTNSQPTASSKSQTNEPTHAPPSKILP